MNEPYVSGSSTSQQAAESIKPSASTLREQVLQAIRASELKGLTDAEGEALTGIDGSTYRPRRVSLHDDGLIIDLGERRRTASGRSSVVWFAVRKP